MNKYEEAIEDIVVVRLTSAGEEGIKNLQELVERATPMKPKYEFMGMGGIPIRVCSKCGFTLKKEHFCFNCGQALDWSE